MNAVAISSGLNRRLGNRLGGKCYQLCGRMHGLLARFYYPTFFELQERLRP